MAIDPKKLSTPELQNLISNYEEKRATERSEYAIFLEEKASRIAPNLKLDTNIAIIRDHASRRDFVSYGAVAKANGVQWIKIYRLIPKHLDNVLGKCHHLKWPMITSIVVNEQNLKTGELEAESLAGFCAGCRRLGIIITDEIRFLREQQGLTFDWAKSFSRT